MKKRIGILSGSFDPIHAGHISLALAALEKANLETVYFLPEPLPRRKTGVTHISHRIAMLHRALKAFPQLQVLELPDRQFSIVKSLPRLKQQFAGYDLYYIMGSDSVPYLATWPHITVFLKEVGLVIAVRSSDVREAVERYITALPVAPKACLIFTSPSPNLSSRLIREAVQSGQPSPDLLASIKKYVEANWIY